MPSLWQRIKHALLPPEESQQRITVHEDRQSIEIKKPFESARTVSISDIRGIDIRVASRGPMLSDLCWIVLIADGEMHIPVEGDHAEAVLRLFETLPDFDVGPVGKAMQQTSNARYTCWRPSSPAASDEAPATEHD